jgi:C4-dicarboxylate-specific signal transduction histidine kinase
MIQPAELTAICEDIIADDLRAGSVIRRIRTLIRKEDVEPQVVAVNEVVMEVLQLMHSDLLLREVSVSTSLGPVPAVSGDRVQLQQVLMNLIVNGCDAMSLNGSGDRGLGIATRDDGALVRIEITDHGPGIPGESIFEPFVTTKPQGLGLGLAICRSIVVAHGGRIWATNNPERGATFHVTLPSAGERAVARLGDRAAGRVDRPLALAHS